MIKSGLQEFPVSPTYCTDPHLAQSVRYIMLQEEQIRWSLMENVFLVLTLLKVVVCFRCSLQLMHFFVHLKHPSVSLSCSGSCGFCVGCLNGISIFLRLLQFLSPTIGGDGAAFLILFLN